MVRVLIPCTSEELFPVRLRNLIPALAVLLAGVTAVPATAAANPYERGPAPTTASVEAALGPYAIASTTVSRSAASGFGGGTIYYPTSTADGTFGGIAI